MSKKLYKLYEGKYPSLLRYPFKSKYHKLESNIKSEPYVPDYKLKPTKKLMKPNFSRTPGCWEMDIMFAGPTTYLVLINVNTRFLIVEPISGKNKDEVVRVLNKILQQGFTINTIKCDGERAFCSLANDNYVITAFIRPEPKIKLNLNLDFGPKTKPKPKPKPILVTEIPTRKCEYYSIKFVIDDSPYTLAHKIVDAVIRTLRNAFGLDNRRIADYNLMRQMVNYYNNTPHSSLCFKNYEYSLSSLEDYKGSGLIPPLKNVTYTPAQVQNNPDLEWQYIRKMLRRLKDVQQMQPSFVKGNIVLCHIDHGKTDRQFDKRRRIFDDIAEFLTYQNGNAVVRLLKPYVNLDTQTMEDIIEVPVAYVKYVCDDIDVLPSEYKEYFDL